jgi:hypothetical protein
MAAQRSRRRPFLNASTAGSDGLRSSVTDARRVRACRSMQSADPKHADLEAGGIPKVPLM